MENDPKSVSLRQGLVEDEGEIRNAVPEAVHGSTLRRDQDSPRRLQGHRERMPFWYVLPRKSLRLIRSVPGIA